MLKVKIYAIITTYNPDLELLEEQYLSLYKQVEGIIYVDNGSINLNELKFFFEYKSKKSKVYFILNSKNMGLGFAQNQGIELSIDKGGDHILLLDHDSVLQKKFVENLLISELKQINHGVKVGLVGPVFFDSDSGSQYPVILEKKFKRKRLYPKSIDAKVTTTIASGSLIGIAVLNEVGLMDEGLFVDFIDNEWCWRAKSFGYEIIVTPNAKMQHKIGDRRITFLNMNMSSHSPLRRYYLIRNGIQAFRYKHVPLCSVFGIAFRNIARLFVILVKFPNKKEYLKYSYFGILDGIKGVQGECTIKKK